MKFKTFCQVPGVRAKTLPGQKASAHTNCMGFYIYAYFFCAYDIFNILMLNFDNLSF